jgi:hypothetical protein
MGGCRIETDSALVAGIQARVEVSFSIRGLLFRFNGLTQWTDGKHVVGIRFVDLTSRRRADLMEILGEVAEANAAEERAAKEEAARALGEAEEQARPEFLPALQVSASADQVED